MQDGAIFRDVDPFASEHLITSLREIRLAGQLKEQSKSFVGDSILRVVEVDIRGLGAESITTPGILGEEISKVSRRNLALVPLEGLPRGSLT